jgi:hypothetical protein
MKIVYGLVMTIIGGLGLLMTGCGIMFLPAQGWGLIGLVPGVLLIWWAVTIGNKRLRSSQDTENSQHRVDHEIDSQSTPIDDGKA